MKTLSVINTVLCLVLAAGVCFLAMRMEQAVARIDELQTAQEENAREISDEISRAWTRIGEFEAESARIAERVEDLSSKGTENTVGVNVEDQIRKILDEESRKHGMHWQREAQKWANVNLNPEQREAAAELARKAAKDYLDLQAKIRAGEVPKEEEGKIIEQWLKENLPKFRENLN